MTSSVRESIILFFSSKLSDFIMSSKSSSFTGEGSVLGLVFAAISVELLWSMLKLAGELFEPPSRVCEELMIAGSDSKFVSCSGVVSDR